ncbi:hypothetical protein ABTW56_24230, partial [Enterobacter roggenkampii]|uniref:hypothetical protein n=1 Tax=Enterobacter roggenkampii TaxID=1812935 RepID=UPI0033157F90
MNITLHFPQGSTSIIDGTYTGYEYSRSDKLINAHITFDESYKLFGLAPIFPYTFYHLTHYWFAAADIPVANDTPVHYADAIRCNVR